MDEKDIEMLVDAARKAAENAYVPYSEFPVGAAVLTSEGKIYTGCNVENSSYPVGICAERVAAANAVASGDMDIVAVAVFSPSDTMPFPCGMCRQFLSEFSDEMDIVTVSNSALEIRKLKELLPCSFKI